MRRRFMLPGILLATLCACADFPDLGRTVPEAELGGAYPPLVPVQGLLAQGEQTRIAEGEDAALEARAAALRARAARLRNR